MNLTISGHHLELTPAIREYITSKVARTKKHFDHVIDVNVLLSVEKLRQKAEATANLRGKALHVEATEADLYAAIDAMADKLERQVLKHKEHLKSHHNESPKRKDVPDPTGDAADE